jgi:release factor glutamine methyltransferase
VAIALAKAGASGAATDVSEEALAIARENAELHGVGGRIHFVKADLFAEGTFDFVISNPPYVAEGEFASLPPEVLHEPRLALDGGPDGMDVLRRIVAGSRARAPRLLLECAPHQAAAVRDLALRTGFNSVQIHRDLDGFDRVIEGTEEAEDSPPRARKSQR